MTQPDKSDSSRVDISVGAVMPELEIWPGDDDFPPTFRVDLGDVRRVWDIRPNCGPERHHIHVYTYERSPGVLPDQALAIAQALVGAVNVMCHTKWRLVRE